MVCALVDDGEGDGKYRLQLGMMDGPLRTARTGRSGRSHVSTDDGDGTMGKPSRLQYLADQSNTEQERALSIQFHPGTQGLGAMGWWFPFSHFTSRASSAAAGSLAATTHECNPDPQMARRMPASSCRQSCQIVTMLEGS